VSRALAASVVIPSFQSAATIDACLEGAFAQAGGIPFEIIVVDSGSDGTAERVAFQYPAARLVKSTVRLDPAAARNRGAQVARGPILAFLDSDCVPDRDWLMRVCAALDSDAYDAVGGAIRNGNGATSASWAGYFCEFREFLPLGAATDATNLTLGNAAYRRAAFERAGGFPEGYFPQEDQVFHRRLLASGARIRFDPSIVVQHAHRSDVAAFLAHQVRIGAANARVVRALDLTGARIASRRWLAIALLPALATYRFGRTVAACWDQERYVMVRRPSIAVLCWLGMMAWGVGFAGAGAAVWSSD
jgi:GT2 family glycosyltransferase